MNTIPEYPLDFIIQINQWQIGQNKSKMQVIGKAIDEFTKTYAPHLRKGSLNCFRRVALPKNLVWSFGCTHLLKERYSSWTYSINIAENFKDGVPPKGYTGVIYHINPNDYEVVLDFTTLYNDETFLQSCKKYETQIKDYSRGIGYFGHRELELIVYVPHLKTTDIFALGGYSHNKEDILKFIYGPEPTKSQRDFVDYRIHVTGATFGPYWLKGERKDNVVSFWIDAAAKIKLKVLKKDQFVKALKNCSRKKR